MIPDLRRKLVSILGANPAGTDAQLLEHARHVVRERTTYKALYEARPAHTVTWGQVELGQMVVAERGPDAGLAVWMIAGRQRGDLGNGTDVLKMLFVRLIEPTEMPEVLWMDKKADDPVTVLDLPGVGNGTRALGELA